MASNIVIVVIRSLILASPPLVRANPAETSAQGILTIIDAGVTLVALALLSLELFRIAGRRRGGSRSFHTLTSTEALRRDDLAPGPSTMVHSARGMHEVGTERFGRDALLPPAGLAPLFSLRDAPLRPNRFAEETVMFAIAAYFLTAAALSAILHRFDGDPPLLNTLLIDNGARVTGSAICIWAAVRRFGGGIEAFIFGVPGGHRRRPGIATAKLAILVIGVAPLIGLVTVWLAERLSPGFLPPEHPTLMRLSESANLAAVLALWIGAGFIGPVAEELFFRGILQTVLVNLLPSRWMAVLCASLAFALVHFNQPHAMPALVFIGVCAGLAYEKTGGILAPCAIHVLFNLRTLVWHALTGDPGPQPP